MTRSQECTLCHHFVYTGVITNRLAKGWQLREVRPRPEGASADVVGIFIARQESGWQVTGELGRQDGRLIVRSFNVQPVLLASKSVLETIAASRTGKPGTTVVAEHFDDLNNADTPRGGVTAQLLRTIPFGALLNEVLVRMALWEVSWPGVSDDGSEPEDWEIGRKAKRTAGEILPLQHQAGRRPNPDDFYREVALECLAIQAERQDRNAIRTLADRRVVPYETARTWVRKARQKGMLAPGSPGRPGLEAGPMLNHDQRSKHGT